MVWYGSATNLSVFFFGYDGIGRMSIGFFLVMCMDEYTFVLLNVAGTATVSVWNVTMLVPWM